MGKAHQHHLLFFSMGVCTFAGLIYSKSVAAIYAYIIKQMQFDCNGFR